MGRTMTAMHTCAFVQPHVDEHSQPTRASTVRCFSAYYAPSWSEPVMSRLARTAGTVEVKVQLSASSYARYLENMLVIIPKDALIVFAQWEE
eukprot:2648340-Rhodomonas_salina.1